MADSRICSIDGCGKPHLARGWCSAHYERWRKHRDPLAGGTSHGTPIEYLENVVLPYNGDECLIWPFGRNSGGYGQIVLSRKRRIVSRVVCEREHGPPPTSKHEAAHNCGKGHEGCVSRKHLVWKTPKENAADRLIHGSSNWGERNGNVRLTSEQAIKIREMKGVASRSALAAMFNVTWQAVYDIQRGRTWK